MTLIIGMQCTDGMVFCADREENTEGVGKRSVSKIHGARGGSWHMSIATAGYGPLADNTCLKIIQRAQETEEFVNDPLPTIESVVKNAYEKFIFPRDSQGQRYRDISLIIGVVDVESKNRFLFKSYEDVVKTESHYSCAGSGVDLAYYFLDQFYGDGLTQKEAYKFLAFILQEAKSSVGGVGLGSEFVSISLFGEYEGFTHRQLVSEAVKLEDIPSLNKCMKTFWRK